MKLAVVGGKLQGMEACYLAAKAGIRTLLVDRRADCPARGLCDEFLQTDICEASADCVAFLRAADLVLPALENDRALAAIWTLCEKNGVPVAFDFDAYEVTKSKCRSDALFHANGIPAPRYYPDCEPPYIFKPSNESGSAGVLRFDTTDALERHIASLPQGTAYVAQEYIEGPSYSIEVIGEPGDYRTYQITQIHIDEVYDCNRVTCPCGLEEGLEDAFSVIAVKIAGLLGLRGIMDVEVILRGGTLYVLEIDARLPSQTPTAIYHSTGVNFIAELCALFTKKIPRAGSEAGEVWHVSFEHIATGNGAFAFPGEHIMAARPPVRVYGGLFGADEAITDYRFGEHAVTGTFISCAASGAELEKKRAVLLGRLRDFK